MGLLEAIVLGLVQGLTEFLPISSTAHLRVAPELLGWPDPGAAYSAVIQLGTVLAVLIYFRRDVGRLTLAFFQGLARRQPLGTEDARLAWSVLLGSVPIAVLGVLLKPIIETSFRSLYVVAGALIVLALVLLWAEKTASHARPLESLTVRDGVLIGIAQALALVPGVSRSGVTLTAGFKLGFQREAAARYSFLLSIPATAGAGLLELKHLAKAHGHIPLLMVAVGTGVSFVSGMAAIAWLLRYLRTRTALVFVGYRIALGVLLLVLLGMGVLQARSGVGVSRGWDAPEADAAFRALAQHLARRPPRTLNIPEAELRASAVLAPFRMQEGVPHLLFTQRPEHLRHHAGQISFPGGAREADDGTAMYTALRELHEELGVAPAHVEVLGALDELPTPSGFRVAPFVGLLPEALGLRPNPDEVAAVLELPLPGFFAAGLPRIEQRTFSVGSRGRSVEVYYYDVNGFTVWGVTGHILRGLFQELAALPAWTRWTGGR